MEVNKPCYRFCSMNCITVWTHFIVLEIFLGFKALLGRPVYSECCESSSLSCTLDGDIELKQSQFKQIVVVKC